MALVVTAPPAVEAQPCLGESPLASSGVQRLRRAVRWYAVASCGVDATSLVVEASARFAAPGSVAAIVADGVGAVALVAAFIVAIGAWVARRRDGSLLLAATLAAVLAAVRPIANALLLSLDQATSADGLDLGLGLLALGGLVWAATAWFAPAGMPARPRGSAGIEMFDRVAEVTSVLILGTAVTGAIVRAVGAS